jgi:signal transduction histidine kinase/CheY-like chemotaxis protein
MSIIRRNKTHKELQKKIDELESSNKILQEKIIVFESSKIDNTSAPNINQTYEDILRLLSSGFLIFNINKDELYISPSLMELFENYLLPEEISSNAIINNSHPDDKNFVADLFSIPKTIKKRVTGQFRLTPKNKEVKETKYFNVVASYSKTDSGENILNCAIRDFTKEIKLFKDLQRSKEKSEEADSIKTIFLSNISHNIRTPMNSILGFAELLSMTDPGVERRKEYIRLIKKQSKNLLQLIDDVGEIAKYESGKMTITKIPCDPELLLKEIYEDISDLRSSLKKEQVKIKLSIPHNTHIEIYTDAGRLHQIFINLIGYSLKNTTQGFIEIGYKIPTDNRIEFFVKDTSQGISKEEQRNIFATFTRVDISTLSRYDEETGLGLTIAKGIIKLLGGKISIESVEGEGILFNFSIPFENVPLVSSDSAEDELTKHTHYRWNNKVILIVEDEEVNGLFLEAVFHGTEARTLFAKNGIQAIELCKSINKIDLILMDIRMPVMNGLKAAQEIRKFNQTIPIIAQTALSLQEDRQQCLMAGFNDTITKPIDVEELLELVNKYICQ